MSADRRPASPGGRPLASALPPAKLEEWMRQYYFDVEIDIGSSGVEEYSMRDLRAILDLDAAIDAIVFRDSVTAGSAPLREAVAARFGLGDAQRVFITHGSSEAIFVTVHALLEPGDTIIALDPCYQQLESIAAGLGCTVRRWRLRPENAFRPDFDDLRRLLTPGVRAVIVNFPHNPTGATITAEEQAELIRCCESGGSHLVWDGAFAELAYDTTVLPDPAARWEGAISFGTLSKAYGLPGLRVGWCTAPKAIVDRFLRIRDYTTLHLSPLVELIAQRAVEEGDRLVQPRLAQARRHREALAAWAGALDSTWERPPGGVCSLVNLGIGDTTAFCHAFCEAERTLIVAGDCFGQPEHVRIGYGKSAFPSGLARLSEFHDKWRAGAQRSMVSHV